MSKTRWIEYLTGFVLGLFFGFVLQSGLLGLYRLLSGWFGWAVLDISIWVFIPFPILVGLFMSKAIADLHLEDYS